MVKNPIWSSRGPSGATIGIVKRCDEAEDYLHSNLVEMFFRESPYFLGLLKRTLNAQESYRILNLETILAAQRTMILKDDTAYFLNPIVRS